MQYNEMGFGSSLAIYLTIRFKSYGYELLLRKLKDGP